jgi:hypothetical protein
MLPKYTVLTNVYYINISKHYQTSLQFWLMTMYSCLSRYYNYLSTGKVSYSLSYFLDWQSTFWNMFEVFVRMGDSYTNPSETKQIEPFWLFFFTKRIHKTNLLNTIEQNESTKRIESFEPFCSWVNIFVQLLSMRKQVVHVWKIWGDTPTLLEVLVCFLFIHKQKP